VQERWRMTLESRLRTLAEGNAERKTRRVCAAYGHWVHSGFARPYIQTTAKISFRDDAPAVTVWMWIQQGNVLSLNQLRDMYPCRSGQFGRCPSTSLHATYSLANASVRRLKNCPYFAIFTCRPNSFNSLVNEDEYNRPIIFQWSRSFISYWNCDWLW